MIIHVQLWFNQFNSFREKKYLGNSHQSGGPVDYLMVTKTTIL